jgi:LPXTG-site transpeptidase (sortase) family protein
MEKKLKISLIAVYIALFIGAGFYVLALPQFNSSKTPSAVVVADNLFGWKFPASAPRFPSTGSAAGGNLAYADIRDPGGIPQGLPVRLQIPAIGVDSAIEDALITADGRMDVPAGTVDVAWFALGPHPGDTGSAVIGGHYGIQNSVPFVFYKLDQLVIGNKIYIINDKGDTLTFVIRSIKSFDRNADTATVFTSDDGLAHLNLITCEGVWNQVNGSYPQRLVVFADLVSPGKVGLPNAGMVSSSTIPIAGEASTTSSGISILSSFFQIALQFVGSTFATPMDGLVTFLLLLSIAFIAFKIFRR